MDIDKARPDQLSAWLVQKVAEIVKRPEEEMDVAATFTRLGIDSLSLLSITGDLASWLGIDLSPSLLMEYPTIQSLTQHLAVQQHLAPAEMIPQVSRDQPVPLTFPQARILGYSKLGPEGDNNVICRRYCVRGPLNQSALQFAFDEIVRRHEILRTTFEMEDGVGLQVVHPAGPVKIELIDLMLEPAAEDKAWKMVDEAANWRMNLREGPLLRVLLLKLGPHDHRLVIVMHHILGDAGSLAILHEELRAHYGASCRGEEPPLAEPHFQMADFAVWQRNWLRADGEPYKKRLAWWQQQLGGALPPPLVFPFSWKEKPQQPPEPVECGLGLDFPGPLAEQFKNLGREENATPYVTFLVAFAVFLQRLTGAEDLVIGTYMSNRTHLAARRLMGVFVSMLPLRIQVPGDLTFRQVLTRTRDIFEQTKQHRELPYEDLQKSLRDEGKPVPDVKVIFQYVRDATGQLELDGLEVDRWGSGTTLKMPWGFGVNIIDGCDTMMRVAFDGNLYDPRSVEPIPQQFSSLLEEVVAHPDRPIRLLEFHHPSEACSVDASEAA